MNAERFYIERPPAGPVVRLSLEESHHLRHVRRLAVGAPVVLFDGSGTDYLGRVEGLDNPMVTVEIERSERSDREVDVEVTLAVAVVKRRRMERLVDMATQLGMRRLVPMRTERSVVEPGGAKLNRWHRIAVEACKQCGRSIVPEIDPVADLPSVLGRAGEMDVALLASLRSGGAPVSSVRLDGRGQALCLIGPEGGFTEAEQSAAVEAGCVPVSLGRCVLRTETAAAAALAVLCGRG
jgi:16S rRNA (uracil1498-N3)-methyltransferase